MNWCGLPALKKCGRKRTNGEFSPSRWRGVSNKRGAMRPPREIRGGRHFSGVIDPFIVVYGACNWITAHRGDVGTWYYEWERRIPFVPVMIVPYMSIDLFFITAPFLCQSLGGTARIHPAHHVSPFLFRALSSWRSLCNSECRFHNRKAGPARSSLLCTDLIAQRTCFHRCTSSFGRYSPITIPAIARGWFAH